MELCGLFDLEMEGMRCVCSEHHMFVDKLRRGIGPIICVFHTSISIVEDAYYYYYYVFFGWGRGGTVSWNRLIEFIDCSTAKWE